MARGDVPADLVATEREDQPLELAAEPAVGVVTDVRSALATHAGAAAIHACQMWSGEMRTKWGMVSSWNEGR